MFYFSKAQALLFKLLNLDMDAHQKNGWVLRNANIVFPEVSLTHPMTGFKVDLCKWLSFAF